MLRWIGLITTFLALIFGLGWGYVQFKAQVSPIKDAYNYVDPSSTIVLEISNPIAHLEQLLSTNLLWETLDESAIYQQLQPLKPFIENYIPGSKDQKLLCVYASNPREWYYILQVEDINSDQVLLWAIQQYANYPNIVIDHENSTVLLGETQYTFAIDHGSLLLATDAQLLETVIHHSVQPTPNPDFEKVRQTASKNVPIKLYFHRNAYGIISDYLSGSYQQYTALPQELGNWTEVDIEYTPNELQLRGFVQENDSTPSALHIFNSQQATSNTIPELLPYTTAFFKRYGFSDFSEVHTRIMETQDSNLFFTDHLMRIDSAYDFNIISEIIGFVDQEVVFSEINQPYATNEVEHMVWLGVSDSRLILERMARLSLATASASAQPYQVISYKEHQIYPIYDKGFLPALLGADAYQSNKNYVTRISDAIVFAPNPAILQYAIDKIQRGQTLVHSPNYQNFIEKNGNTSNYLVYLNPAKYRNRLGSQLNEQGRGLLSNAVLKNYRSFAFQASYEREHLFYLDLFTAYSPAENTASNILWELELDTTSMFKPYLFTNHYTGVKELFIQDDLYNVYLISNKGQVLWKKRLEGKIQSDVSTIDIYHNAKGQLFFNTKNRLYVLDRNGNHVNGFPVKFTADITGDFTPIQYKNATEYRFIGGLSNGKIVNVDKNGKPVKGWNYAATSRTLNSPIHYGNIKGRDYLMAMYSDGHIVALNRRGEVRLSFSSTLPTPIAGAPFYKFQSHLEKSYLLAVSSAGEFSQVFFDNQSLVIGTYPFSNQLFFDTDKDGSIENVLINKNHITSYSLDGHQTMNLTGRDTIIENAQFFDMGDHTLLGYQNTASAKLYLSYPDGELLEGFPLEGKSPFTLFDINRDGRYNIITTAKEGVLKVYHIDL